MHPPTHSVPRKAPVRRPRARRPLPRRKPARWRLRLLLSAAALVAATVTWAALARAFAPTGNTSARRFDAIIVLGARVDREGNPTPALLARITEAVREYERGVAPRLIVSGGLDYGRFSQADAMARVAQALGVPSSAIFLEPHAEDTIQNACYSARIMKSHGWQSAEIISSATHLPRAGLIFNRTPISWSAHAAPPLMPVSSVGARSAAALEVLKTLRYLLYADWADRCSP